MSELLLLSAGAASGLVQVLKSEFEQTEACTIGGEFGAVGAMKERLLAGVPCDVVISSEKVFGALQGTDWVQPASVRPVGRVSTAAAVVKGSPKPPIHDVASMAAALRGASGIYLPDMARSTAGGHMRRVFEQLGVFDLVRDKLHEFKNGATAMRAMADSDDPHALGCTQATEILYTRGVELIAPLPGEIGLSTLYEAAVAGRATQGALAARFVEYLTGPGAQSARRSAGFA